MVPVPRPVKIAFHVFGLATFILAIIMIVYTWWSAEDCVSKGNTLINISLVARQPVFWVYDQIRHNSHCAVTVASMRLEISELETKQRLYYQGSEIKGIDELPSSPDDNLAHMTVVRKPVFGVFDLVRHKPGCTTVTAQLICVFVLCICKKLVFS